MKLLPHGNLKASYQASKSDLYKKMPNFSGSDTDYRDLLQNWLDDIATLLWPKWENGQWSGAAAEFADTATELELRICQSAFQHTDILKTMAAVHPDLPDHKKKTHEWHYTVEDAGRFDRKDDCLQDISQRSFENLASRDIASNFAAYVDLLNPGPTSDDGVFASQLARFESDFWGGIAAVSPSIWDIKELFMRPRPYSVATFFGLHDFRWQTADTITHTGVHPSILSGHCIQGLLGGCNTLAAWQRRGYGDESTISALKQYAVDWGDRRVFAGVHYPTDNIASWTLALRLIPHVFEQPAPVLDFARGAIKSKSAVYQVVAEMFPGSPLERSLNLLERELR